MRKFEAPVNTQVSGAQMTEDIAADFPASE